ncbi:hypothetical protein OTB20_01765 [Streptomyces sp. H27-H1]|uniref:hypothetical protein n=1 Tax=Streptomyces sp. H27-H1 TaxID=2996461 RepID=UPI002271EA06|nr:hypothetical protein [Streptomyces sp. H27-H1]MCY0924952.1 hypothetical protein [Streptomyces sp. H27-H1]
MSGEGAVSADRAARSGTRRLGPVELSVVIPGPVPDQALMDLREYLDAHCGAGPGAWELLVVDGADDSPADPALVAAAAEEPRIRLIRLGAGDGPSDSHSGSDSGSDSGRSHGHGPGRTQGKGAALRAGVLASAGHRVLLTDAALSTPLDELARLEEGR